MAYRGERAEKPLHKGLKCVGGRLGLAERESFGHELANKLIICTLGYVGARRVESAVTQSKVKEELAFFLRDACASHRRTLDAVDP